MAEELSANALITFDRLEADMGPLDIDDYAVAIRLINAVSARANTITRRKLKGRTYSDVTLDGTGSDLILLPQYPVTAVSEVKVDSARAFGAATVVDTDDWEYDGDTGELFIWTKTPKVRRCVRVSYTAGYVTVPDDLQYAIVEAVAYSWKQLSSKTIGTRSITGDGITTQYEIDIPIPAMRVIESYTKERGA